MSVSSLELRAAIEQIRRDDAENNQCIECGKSSTATAWASVPFGCFLCFDCCAPLRSLGLRHCVMDSWTREQLQFLKMGGNHKLKEYLRTQNIPSNLAPLAKYESAPLVKYRGQLRTLVMETTPPTPYVRDTRGGETQAPREPRTSRCCSSCCIS